MAGPSLERPKDFKGSVRRLLSMLRPERPIIVIASITAAASVAASVWGPKVLGQATNIIFAGFIGKHLSPHATKQQVVAQLRASGKGNQAGLVSSLPIQPGHGIDFDHLGRVLGVVALIYLAALVLGAIQGRLAAKVVQRAMFRLRQQAEDKLARLPLSYFDRLPRGEVLSRVTNDIDNLAQNMQQTLSQLMLSVLTIVGVLAFMFWISWLLALIALVTIPVSILIARQITKKSKPQFVKQWSTTGKLNGHIEEMYTGHTLVKVFGRQKEAAETFTDHNEALYQASFKGQFIAGLMMPVMMFISNINYVLVAVVGGLKVASGSLSLGDVQAFIQYSRQFSQPVNQLASMANMLQSGVASAERVFALLDATEQEPDKPGAIVPAEIDGRVAFEHVRFSYDPEKPLITDLSLRVEPGQTVAIVGPTGAGKTTLVNLLMRFYEVDGGRITVDGIDTGDMTREGLRAKTGMVLQDAWLFGGTIAENIAYGAKNPTMEQIVAAARATHVDHFVRTLPDGYDTVLDDDGSNLSAGERQLVTIARAFLAEPAILILDEATSSVDTRTEVLIQRAMRKLRQGRTSFIIAHRLSTIRDADLILVMEHGDIVEQGTHDELVNAAGPYQRLYAAQFAQAVVEVA
ncbi:MAG TPA: ABC transporter ATP-binding protein [Streptosporangiaceae bacterium]|nr:ABC transporter ATP-binding protein [Streptosporangiaceae bacterium]